jgi:hypothetical protein
MWAIITVSLLTFILFPNGHSFAQLISFFTIFTIHDPNTTETIILFVFFQSTISINMPSIYSLTFFFNFAGISELMAPKSKHSEIEENPFLPLLLTWTESLCRQRSLISEPKVRIDFLELHLWLKDTFLDQSDEIGTLGVQSPTVFSPKFTISLSFPSSARHTISPIREPSFHHLERPFSPLHPKP